MHAESAEEEGKQGCYATALSGRTAGKGGVVAVVVVEPFLRIAVLILGLLVILLMALRLLIALLVSLTGLTVALPFGLRTLSSEIMVAKTAVDGFVLNLFAAIRTFFHFLIDSNR